MVSSLGSDFCEGSSKPSNAALLVRLHTFMRLLVEQDIDHLSTSTFYLVSLQTCSPFFSRRCLCNRKTVRVNTFATIRQTFSSNYRFSNMSKALLDRCPRSLARLRASILSFVSLFLSSGSFERSGVSAAASRPYLLTVSMFVSTLRAFQSGSSSAGYISLRLCF